MVDFASRRRPEHSSTRRPTSEPSAAALDMRRARAAHRRLTNFPVELASALCEGSAGDYARHAEKSVPRYIPWLVRTSAIVDRHTCGSRKIPPAFPSNAARDAVC